MGLELFYFLRRSSVGVGVGLDDVDVEVAVLEKVLEGEVDLTNPGVSDEDEVIRLPVEPVVTETPLSVAGRSNEYSLKK